LVKSQGNFFFMIFDIFLLILVALLTIPLIGGYYAHAQGRSFWLWFLISCFLPVISYFILILLPSRKNPVAKELEELRIRNRMLGTVPDIPMNAPLREEIITATICHIHFCKEEDTAQPRVRIKLGTLPFEEWLQALPWPPNILPSDFKPLPLSLALFPFKHFLGTPSVRYQKGGRPLLLAGEQSIHEGCLGCTIQLYRKHIVWHSFFFVKNGKEYTCTMPQILVFDKLQYQESLELVVRE
jgi:hypothetical protein